MRLFFFFIPFFSLIQGQLTLEHMEPGKRGDKYRAWVYFMDKNGSTKADISDQAWKRRLKNNIKSNSRWLDLEISNNYIEALKKLNLIVRRQSRWLNAVSIETDIKTLNTILKFDFVKKIDPVIGFTKNSTNDTVTDVAAMQISENNERDFDLP